MTAGENTIAVIDYGMGNLRSVLNALHEVRAVGKLVTDASAVNSYGKVILPGVGAFSQAIKNLHQSGMAEALEHARKRNIPILGICLGMQLMCKTSEEDGLHQGLGWIDAVVRRFPDRPGLKIPHIGWNDLKLQRRHYLVDGLPSHPDVYFVHSYRVECADQNDILASCEYGEDFTAMFARNNVMGIQFHPEKSQAIGLRILKNFTEQGRC